MRPLALLLLCSSLALPAGAVQGELPQAVRSALRAAAPAGARVELVGYRGPSGCRPEQVDVEHPVLASGPVPLRVTGAAGASRCAGAALAEVRVFAQVWVTRTALAAGEPVAPALVREERELRAGHEPSAEVPSSLRAARAIPAGTLIEPQLLFDPGWTTGAPVRVLVRSGAVLLTELGRLVPCVPGRACALLPSGRRVEGRRDGQDVLVEVP